MECIDKKIILFLRGPSYRQRTCPETRSKCTHRPYGLKLHRLSTIERPDRARRPRDRSFESFCNLFCNTKILTKSTFLVKKE